MKKSFVANYFSVVTGLVFCFVIVFSTDTSYGQRWRRQARCEGVTSCLEESALFEVMPTRELFNGKDLTGWTNVKGDQPPKGWHVVDGMIHHKADSGDLYYKDKYENFILEFEFKISKKGNSGVKYRSWNKAGYGLGYEYQIFDNLTLKTSPRTQTAGLYDMYEPLTDAHLLNLEGFNKGKIVVMGNYIEHWLNGQRTMYAEIGSCEWQKRLAKSKFADTKEYGTTQVGRILLQDHNSEVWFKNIKITPLEKINSGVCRW